MQFQLLLKHSRNAYHTPIAPPERRGFLLAKRNFDMETSDLFVSDRDFARLAPITRNHPLDGELGRAIVVPDERMPADIVRLYSRVTYLDESTGISRQIELVLPEEADVDAGRISVLTPVGSALLGLRRGQSIQWPFPSGFPRRLKVLAVVPQLQPQD
jgi:regulator of nucleoside diphosphate kinase